MKKLAFTMAEILLSLTIIGVVAAITLPSLMGNINERTWNTQRKALHARMSQAIAMMPQLNGYGTYVADTKDAAGSVTSSGTDTAAEAFLTEGLSKVLKINNICDFEHLDDCGVPSSLTKAIGGAGTTSRNVPTTLGGLNYAFSRSQTSYGGFAPIDTKAAAFETQNGESIVVYYNPNCQPDMGETSDYLAINKMCANFLYDLNGNKGPNTINKDMGFVTVFYSSDPVVVAPILVGYSSSDKTDETRLPNVHEAMSLIINDDYVGSGVSDYFVTTTPIAGSIEDKWGVVTGQATEVVTEEGGGEWYVKR